MDGLPLTVLDGRELSNNGPDVCNDGVFVRINVGRRVRIKVGRLVSGFVVGWLTGLGGFVGVTVLGGFVGFIVGAIRGGLVIDDGGEDGRRVRLEVGGSVESNVGCSVRGDDVGAEMKQSKKLVSSSMKK
jgi:hypothetical protein